MTDVVIRRAWKKMEDPHQVEALFQAAWAFKEANAPQAIYAVNPNYHECLRRPTWRSPSVPKPGRPSR